MTAPLPTRDLAPSSPQQPESRWEVFLQAAVPIAMLMLTVWLPRFVAFAWKYIVWPAVWLSWWVFRFAWNFVCSMFGAPMRL